MATFSLAHAKEAADTDYDGRDLAVFSKHDVIDLADRLVGGIRDLRADELAGAHLTWLMRVELTIGGGGRARLCLGFGRLRWGMPAAGRHCSTPAKHLGFRIGRGASFGWHAGR